MLSDDLGKTWSGPKAIKQVNRIAHENGLLEAPVDMTPQYHPKSGKVLVTGATFWQDLETRKNIPKGPSDTAYTVYDPTAQDLEQLAKTENARRSQVSFCPSRMHAMA